MSKILYVLANAIPLLNFAYSLPAYSSLYSLNARKGLIKPTGTFLMESKSENDWNNNNKLNFLIDNSIVNKLLTGAGLVMCTTVFSLFSGSSISVAQSGYCNIQHLRHCFHIYIPY